MTRSNQKLPASAETSGPIVLLSGSSSVARGIAAYYKKHYPDGDLLIVEERGSNKAKLLQFIRRRARNRGWLSVIDALAGRLIQGLVDGLFVHQPVTVVEPDLVVADCNDPAIPRLVNEVNARLIILNLCSLISAAQLEAIGCPVINVHPGINPRYRGAGNVWALSEGRFELVGVTVHFVDAGIDTGAVIAYAAVDPVSLHLGVEDTFVFSQRAGADLAMNLAKGIEPPPVPSAFKDLPSRLYPYPGLSTWLRAWRNLKCAQRKGGQKKS